MPPPVYNASLSTIYKVKSRNIDVYPLALIPMVMELTLYSYLLDMLGVLSSILLLHLERKGKKLFAVLYYCWFG